MACGVVRVFREQMASCKRDEREGPIVDNASGSPEVTDADSDETDEESAAAVVTMTSFGAHELTTAVKSLLD